MATHEKTNLWLYNDLPQMYHISISLIAFGAETLKTAKIIEQLERLKQLKQRLDTNRSSQTHIEIGEFALSYIMDSIKIMIFFENYMKAELIMKNYCVHRIDRNISGFKNLAKEQQKRPISLMEIAAVKKFEVIQVEEKIYHEAILRNTIGVKDLLASEEYLKHYLFDNDILDCIIDLNETRNTLHFHGSVEFKLSTKFINQLEKINVFVDKIVGERILKRLSPTI